MTQAIGWMTAFVIVAPLADAADPSIGGLFSEAAKYGIWALVAVGLGYLMVQEKKAMAARIKEIEDYQRNTLEKLVVESSKAIEAVTEIVKGCPNRERN